MADNKSKEKQDWRDNECKRKRDWGEFLSALVQELPPQSLPTHWEAEFLRVLPICPYLEDDLKHDDWQIPNIAKSGSRLRDSLEKIMCVFGTLMEFRPTEEAIVWCAHNRDWLWRVLGPIQEDIELLPLRMEKDFPDTCKRIRALHTELMTAIKDHKVQQWRGRPVVYLPCPEGRNFENWRGRLMLTAKLEDPDGGEDTVRGLTDSYPAEVIKVVSKMYKELERPLVVLREELGRRTVGPRPKIRPLLEGILDTHSDWEHKPDELTDEVNKRLRAQGLREVQQGSVKNVVSKIRKERETRKT
ncbi:MAG: hypothetical protein ACYS74_02640 [Planctomycetota bacterium]